MDEIRHVLFRTTSHPLNPYEFIAWSKRGTYYLTNDLHQAARFRTHAAGQLVRQRIAKTLGTKRWKLDTIQNIPRTILPF
jgi:hypothetical protein